MLHSLSRPRQLVPPPELVVETTRLLESKHGDIAGFRALERAAAACNCRERSFWLKVARCAKADRERQHIAEDDMRERFRRAAYHPSVRNAAVPEPPPLPGQRWQSNAVG